MHPPAILWLRQDLRLADHPALAAAIAHGGPVMPVFIWSPEEEGAWPPGAASRWWLQHSLASLAASLEKRGSRLIVCRGPSERTILELVKQTKADAVFWSRRYELTAIERDTRIKRTLQDAGLIAESFNSALLHEPWNVLTQQRQPYQVFTPFWKTCLARETPAEPLPTPRKLVAPDKWPHSLALDELELLPSISWDSGMREAWTPGEAGAAANLKRFLAAGLADYDEGRDRPAMAAVSQLSPYLHFGELSPRQVWHAVAARAAEQQGRIAKPAETYLKELGWREFAYHLLFHFPRTTDAPLREKFARFPWRHDAKVLRAWQRGRTGYPLVDAGMRQLWTTGWMHNRVRMIVASFLVKHLLIPWQSGAKWFWDTLVDADLASNTLGWQWTAGCGADAAPYFRIFNPVSQGEKFDAAGGYIRRWVPELAKLDEKWIHRPWDAPADVLQTAGVQLGKTYPKRIVDHDEARRRALAALETTSEK